MGNDMPGHAGRHCTVSCTTMSEPIDLPFGLWTRVGRRKHKFNRIRQLAPMCPHGRAHWCHLANAIELVLPLAHPCPQPKRQIDRFSCFCTAHARVSSDTFAPPGEHDRNCAQWHHLANTIELVLLLAHPRPQPKWQIEQFSRFCTTHGRKSLYFTMGDHFP